MDQERRDKIDEIFQAALEMAPEERKAFVQQACEGNEGLSAAVNRLIEAHEHAEADGFIANLTFHIEGLATGSHVGLSPEQRVGPYKIVSQLGRGGMGEVYLAHDTRLDRSVALKILALQLTTDEERVRRFRQEALAASSLNHPNIITVYEIGEHEGRDFIATEFVEGVTLRTRMRGKRLSLAEAFDIVLQVAGALTVAHAAGIVHRDIKPENVMVRPDGLVKVLDFGIAKYTPPTRPSDSKQEWVKTATGVVIGTTAYMSPEQARGKEVDARTDIWSLGVILYEMMTRRLPFPGQTPTDRIAAILERDPEPLSRRRSSVSPELEKIVQRALVKNREERYQQAADLADDLRKVSVTIGDVRTPRFNLPRPVRSLSAFSRTRVVVALVALMLLIAVVVTALNYLRPRDEAIDSVAVLPFVNASGNAEMDYLSDGISENLINSLSQLPEVKVAARSSSFKFKGRQSEISEVAKALSVRAIITGRVVQREDSLQVSVELVDARDGSQVWGERYDRKLADTQSVQDEIARAIAERLRKRLTRSENQLPANPHRTKSDEAYQSYLLGRFHWNKRTGEGIQKAIEHFNQAIEKDPGYALAYAGLADCYVVPANSAPPSERMPRARAAAQRALELDETLAEAHTTLARVLTLFDWDWAGAEREYKRALELNPRYAVAHQWYGGYLASLGQHDGSIAERRRALELDPLSVIINFELEQAFYHSRDYDRAIEQGQKTLELDQNFPATYAYLPATYEQKGMYREAIAGFQKGQALKGGTEWSLALAGLGHVYAKTGRKKEARAVLDELKQLSRQGYVPADSMALVHAGLAEKDEAFAWLDKAFAERSFRLVHIKVEPRWDSLRSDPRYAQLLRRMNLNP
jgi:serine/threonine-protein kinase